MRRVPTGTLRRRGRVWWLRYAVEGHRYAESLYTADRKDAVGLFKQRMATIRAEAMRGVLPPRSAPRQRLARVAIDDAWPTYLQSRSRPQSGEATLRMYGYQFNGFVSWLKQSHPDAACLGGVTEEIADEFLEHIENDGKASPGTYNKYVDTLRRTFRYATGNGGKAATPWDHVRRKKGGQNRRRDFSVDEVTMLIGRATCWIRTLLVIGLYSGQRLVDCCRLSWDQVDFGEDLIRVVPNKTRNSSGLRVELPMHPDLRSCLEGIHHSVGCPRSGFVLPEVADRYTRNAPEVSKDIQAFIGSCGFVTHKVGTGVAGVRAVVQYGFHSLRHTFVSICLRSEKVNREVIRSIVGDSYLLYNHVGNASKRTAVELLPSISSAVNPWSETKAATVEADSLTDDQIERTIEVLASELARRKNSGMARSA
jgi:integrase